MLQELIEEREYKIQYLRELYSRRTNAANGNYARRIAFLRNKMESIREQIALLESRIEIETEAEKTQQERIRVEFEVRVYNVLISIGRDFSELVKQTGRRSGNRVSSQRLFRWCLANLAAMQSGDEQRLQILFEEYVEEF